MSELLSGNFTENLAKQVETLQVRNDLKDIKKDGNLWYTTNMLTEIITNSVIGQESAILNANVATTASSSVILEAAASIDPTFSAMATPANVKCTLSIPTERLSPTTTTLSKDVSFSIGGNRYVLMDDISILLTSEDTYYTKYLDNAHHMKYDKSIKNVNGKLYNTMQYTSTGTTNLLIHDVHIMQIEYADKPIAFPDLETLLTMNYEYTVDNNKQLCGINILYKNPTDRSFREIPYYTQEMIYTDREYIFFKMISDTTFRFYFSNIIGAFVPNADDAMIIRLYYTDGAGANSQRTRAYDININSIPISVEIDGGYIQNGMDKRTIEEIRLSVQRSMQNPTLKTITTDSETSLVIEKALQNVNSDAKIYRYRDDLYRELRVFATLRDSEKKVIPTNTVNLSISYRQFKKMGNKLTPNDVIIYDEDAGVYRLMRDDEVNYIFNLNQINKKHTYASPFLLKLEKYTDPANDKYGIYYVQPHMVYINDTYDMIETEMKTYDLVGIFKHLQIIRDPYSDSYKVFFTFDDRGKIESLRSNIYFEIVFKNKEGRVIGMDRKLFDASINNSVNFELKTKDNFLPNEFKMLIHNSLYKTQADPDKELTSEFDEFFDVEVNVYGRQETFALTSDNNNDVIVLGGEKFILTNKYSINDVSLFKRMDRYFDTNLYLDGSSNFNINIPVVSNFYLKNTRNFNYIMGELESVYTGIDTLLTKLIDNVDISIKFINSCGPAHLTPGISKTNVSMKLGLKVDLDVEDLNLLKQQYAKDIAKYIETINDGVRITHSSLLTFIQGLDKVQSASIILFNGLNKVDDMYSITNDLDNRYSIDDDVPEYINIGSVIKTAQNNVKTIEYDIEFKMA